MFIYVYLYLIYYYIYNVYTYYIENIILLFYIRNYITSIIWYFSYCYLFFVLYILFFFICFSKLSGFYFVGKGTKQNTLLSSTIPTQKRYVH